VQTGLSAQAKHNTAPRPVSPTHSTPPSTAPTGELAVCEPKTLRYRLLHTAARLAFHARRATLRIQNTWPWAEQLAAAFQRLAALPPPAG
jgi:hypothetical protein